MAAARGTEPARGSHPTARVDALYSLLTMSGVSPRFDGAVRINSDILTWPDSPGRGGSRCLRRRTAAAAWCCCSAPARRAAGDLPDGTVQRMRVGQLWLGGQVSGAPDARESPPGHRLAAGAQIMAIRAVRAIERVRATVRGASVAKRRTGDAGETRHRRRSGRNAREAVTGADVVMCATNSMGPVGCRMAGAGNACEQFEAPRTR